MPILQSSAGLLLSPVVGGLVLYFKTVSTSSILLRIRNAVVDNDITCLFHSRSRISKPVVSQSVSHI